MTFDSSETSVDDATPIECYKFIGTLANYLYTSYHEDVTVNGEEYIAIPISRKKIKSGTHADDALAVDITMPDDTEVVQVYAYQNSPSRLDLEIRRVHRSDDIDSDSIIIWSGEVSSFNITGRKASLRVPSILSRALVGVIPSLYYQNQCNNTLYDFRCSVDRVSNTVTREIDSFDANTITVTVSIVEDDYIGGEVVSITGERRMIISNTTIVLTMNFPFTTLSIGDNLDIARGCDHVFRGDCENKFLNTDNYGGFPYIPNLNPFKGDL